MVERRGDANQPIASIMFDMNDTPLSRPPITDSPLYWIYLFCTAGLIALFLAGPKFSARQTQIERKYEARQLVAQNVARGSTSEAAPQDSRTGTRITLLPLYITLGGVLSVAWVSLWWRHYRHSPALSRQEQIEETIR